MQFNWVNKKKWKMVWFIGHWFDMLALLNIGQKHQQVDTHDYRALFFNWIS